MVLPIKSLTIIPKEAPLGCKLRWQFNQYEAILDFQFNDSGDISDFYGLYYSVIRD